MTVVFVDNPFDCDRAMGVEVGDEAIIIAEDEHGFTLESTENKWAEKRIPFVRSQVSLPYAVMK